MANCKRCGKDHGNAEPADPEKIFFEHAKAMAREIDKEVLLQAGEMMSTKGYTVASTETEQFRQSQLAYREIFEREERKRIKSKLGYSRIGLNNV